MNSFQIVDKEGNAITLKQLDIEAAEFWGREVHPKWYASPKPEGYEEMSGFEQAKCDLVGNWFDIVGYNIANQGTFTSGWTNVIHTMCAERFGEVFIQRGGFKIIVNASKIADLQIIAEYYTPYLKLIEHWALKGYQPRQIKE